MKKIFCLLTVFLAFAWNASAEMAIETAVSRSRVSVGDQITLDIIVSNAEGTISRPTITSIDGFSSYSQGHSQEISIVNGVKSSRSIFSYVLIANSAGKKTIGPFEIKVADKAYKVAAVEVEVTTGQPARQAAWPAAASPLPPSAPNQRALPATVGNDDIFVKAWLDKDEVYINEPVILTYTIYTRLSATYKGFEKEPVTTGFWIEDFPPEKNVRKTEQVLNGSRYVVADVRKIALFPTQAGVFTIEPGRLSALVELQEDFNNFFSYNIFGYRRSTVPSPMLSQMIAKTLTADPVTVAVKTLPEAGKPAGFSGALGSYRIESSVDKTSVQAGDPVTYRLRVTGQGNINTLQVPLPPQISDVKVYDSSSSVNIKKDRLLVEGEKVVDTVLVPRKEGSYTIPPAIFSYFDPAAKAYKEIRSSAHTIQASPGEEPLEDAAAGGYEPVEKKDVSVVAKDIRYIKTGDTRAFPPPHLHQKPFFWVLVIFLGAASWAFSFAASRRDEISRDLKGLRFRRSHRLAKKKLQNADRLMKKGDHDAFYAEISTAVYGYFADKLNQPAQNINYETIAAALSGKDTSEAFLGEIRMLLDELSFGRFARTEKNMEAMKKVYQDADRVITQFDRMKLK